MAVSGDRTAIHCVAIEVHDKYTMAPITLTALNNYTNNTCYTIVMFQRYNSVLMCLPSNVTYANYNFCGTKKHLVLLINCI